MHNQSNGYTMVMGGVDRSAEFRRQSAAGQRHSAALLGVIALLMVTTGWLAGIVVTQQVAAVTSADIAPRHANVRPADREAPPAPEAYMFP